MKLTRLLLAVLTIAILSGCKDKTQQTISEFGSKVAEEFLSSIPTLFQEIDEWTEDMFEGVPTLIRVEDEEEMRLYPYSCDLYDLNLDGIPEIVLYYGNINFFHKPDEPVYAFHEYVKGKYVISQAHGREFTRDPKGQVYTFRSDHYNGLTEVYLVTFTKNGMNMKLVTSWDDEDFDTRVETIFNTTEYVEPLSALKENIYGKYGILK
jgi:hypothetical protein